MTHDDLVRRLRDVASAYPEDIFPPFTDDERRENSVIISRASGNMGRFLSKPMLEAAARIEALEAQLALYRDAVRVDVLMEGPQFKGANTSALKRAWEEDRKGVGNG